MADLGFTDDEIDPGPGEAVAKRRDMTDYESFSCPGVGRPALISRPVPATLTFVCGMCGTRIEP